MQLDDNKIKDVNQKDTRKGIRMDREIVEYNLIKNDDANDEAGFIDKVNRHIKNGWQPLGGLSFRNRLKAVQAMVKYRNVNK